MEADLLDELCPRRASAGAARPHAAPPGLLAARPLAARRGPGSRQDRREETAGVRHPDRPLADGRSCPAPSRAPAAAAMLAIAVLERLAGPADRLVPDTAAAGSPRTRRAPPVRGLASTAPLRWRPPPHSALRSAIARSRRRNPGAPARRSLGARRSPSQRSAAREDGSRKERAPAGTERVEHPPPPGPGRRGTTPPSRSSCGTTSGPGAPAQDLEPVEIGGELGPWSSSRRSEAPGGDVRSRGRRGHRRRRGRPDHPHQRSSISSRTK